MTVISEGLVSSSTTVSSSTLKITMGRVSSSVSVSSVPNTSIKGVVPRIRIDSFPSSSLSSRAVSVIWAVPDLILAGIVTVALAGGL